MNPWDQIKKRLEAALSPQSYRNWINRTIFSHMEDGTLFVTVPDEDTRHWLELEYAEQIAKTAESLDAGIRSITYQLSGTPRKAEVVRPVEEGETAPPPSQLNPRFTFDTFVVGNCNQLAHAAAKSVASKPSRSYNPLFIYGGVGMGKTHLLHAIGHTLAGNTGKRRIVYTSTERFMNEMITCIRLDRLSQFQDRYRSADVLLIDDIQLLSNKERTQEEFFHTFNALHDAQRQIVISSDSSPKEIPNLIERLRSRFEWGLIADMQPPDLETKMAILDKKAEVEGVSLPDDVRYYIAQRPRTNVRELEGALVKLVAYSSLTDTPINLTMAQQVLKAHQHTQEKRITIDAVQKAAAERLGVRQSQLKEKSNSQGVVFPRQVAMYLAKELTHASLPEIGRAFGGKHHTTVIHSINKIQKQRQNDLELNRLINSIIDSFQ